MGRTLPAYTVLTLRFQVRVHHEANISSSNTHYAPHSHAGLTTHLILSGELTITYSEDPKPEKFTYDVGDRIDVAAGRMHEVWIGGKGCTYVIGE